MSVSNQKYFVIPGQNKYIKSKLEYRRYIEERLIKSRKGMVEYEEFQQLHRLQHKGRITF